MGFFDAFRQPDINLGVSAYRNASGAVLLDVRTPEEYRSGHIPGSQNLPLQSLEDVQSLADEKDTALYVYCRSGNRSRQAAGLLQRMGYANVTNIGGISAYAGRLEQ